MTEKIKIVVTGDSKDAEDALKDTDSGLQKTEKSFSGAAAAAGVFATAVSVGVVAALSKTIEVTREFDILNAGLKTATGSAEAAAEQFELLEKFASETPYALQQSVDAFIKLKNFGLDPSERALRSYGDTSAALGKDLEQMIEAVADAATGEFERLKEFGIRSKNQGDTIAFTFKGITTEVENNAAAIEEHLIRLGENNFAGAMSERMATLDGAISNFGDSWDALFRSIGKSPIGDLIEQGFRGATEAIQELTGHVDELSGQTATPINEATEAAITFGNAQLRIENITNRLNKINSANEQTINRITEARDRQIAIITQNIESEQSANAIREKFNAKYQVQIDAIEQAQSQSATLLQEQLANEVASRNAAKLALDAYVESAKAAHQAEIGDDIEEDTDLSDQDQKAFDRLQRRFMSEQELLAEKLSQEQLILVDGLLAKELTQEEFYARQLYLAAVYENDLSKITQKGLSDREKFQAKSGKDQTKQVLGEMSSLLSGVASSNKAMFDLNKVAAISTAGINMYKGISHSLGAYPMPLAGVMAALHGAVGVANIANIKSQSFGGGGASAPSVGGVSAPTMPKSPAETQAQAQPQEPREINITFSGIPDDQIFSGRQMRELVTEVVDNINDGGFN